MNLQFPFYKFPFRFDVQRLQDEVNALPESAWRFHHENFKGNSALHLITTNGTFNDDFEAPMRPTEHLEICPYIMQIMSRFDTLLGRARLMRLEPGHGVPAHFDMQQYWRTHTRVHIPVVTHPDIWFHSGDQSVHMAEGEAWTFDNWRVHKVVNETQVRRIHLTFDTFGSTAFWNLAKPLGREEAPRLVVYEKELRPRLSFETYVESPVMAPGEVELELSRLVADAAAFPGNDQAAVAQVMTMAARLRNEWRILWHSMGPTPEGIPHFAKLMRQALDTVPSIPESVKMLSNGRPLAQALPSTLTALVRPAAQGETSAGVWGRAVASDEPRFDRPIFIVSAPRSGSTWLYEMVVQNEILWSLGGEGHQHVEQIATLDPRRRNFDSNRLGADDALRGVDAQLRANYLSSLCDAQGRHLRDFDSRVGSLRFLEKTPKNAIRIPFLKAVFPDAKFVFLFREAKANISAIMDAWRSGRFVTYSDLPGWQGLPWSLLLIPGWRNLNGARLEQIAARQWSDANDIILNDLEMLPPSDWCALCYEDLVRDPFSALNKLCAFAEIPFGPAIQKAIERRHAFSRYTLTPPHLEKWRKNEKEIATIIAQTRSTADRLSILVRQATTESAQ